VLQYQTYVVFIIFPRRYLSNASTLLSLREGLELGTKIDPKLQFGYVTTLIEGKRITLNILEGKKRHYHLRKVYVKN